MRRIWIIKFSDGTIGSCYGTRSGAAEILINFNTSVGIDIEEGPMKTTVASYVTGCRYLLGEYSNKQKAVKVLDMLQETYAEHEILLQTFTGISGVRVTTTEKESIDEKKKEIREKAIFQMPEDSEVGIND